MSDKNMFLGAATYPHDSRASEYLRGRYGAHRGHYEWRALEESFNAGLAEANKYSADRIEQLEQAVQVREDAAKSAFKDSKDMQEYAKKFRDIGELQKARIEQLERELAEAQKGHARYEYVRKITPQEFKARWIENLKGKASFDDLIDAAIQERKA